MPLSKAEQDAIMIADLTRRHERKLLEDAALGIDVNNQQSDAFKIAHAKKHSHVNPVLVRNIGVVCPPPHTSASQNCWNRGMKGTTKGVAPGSTKSEPSVRITRNGVSIVVPANGFGKSNKQRRSVKPTTVAWTPETAKIHLNHNFND